MGDGGKGMKQAFSRAFGIEIDHYALIGFTGVIKLIRNVGGVDVTLAEPYYDPYYWVNNHHRGWGLPAGKSHLDADDALIFARSRKGDSDFQRAKRQQQLVMAAVAKVRKRGLDELPQAAQHRQGDGPHRPADSTAPPTCSRSTARSTWPRSIGRSSDRRSSRSATAAPTTSWSSTCASSGSRTTSRPRGRSERGPAARRRNDAPPARERRDRLLEGAGVDLVRDGAHPATVAGCGAHHAGSSCSTRCGTRCPWRPGRRSASRT